MSDIPPPPDPTNDQPPGPGYWQASDGNWYPPAQQPTMPMTPAGPPVGPFAVAVPAGTQLSSLGKRFGGAVLTAVLIFVTLVIGYVIWAFIDGVLGQVTFGIFGLVSTFWIFAGDTRQRLTDKMVNTIVVDAPNGLAL